VQYETIVLPLGQGWRAPRQTRRLRFILHPPRDIVVWVPPLEPPGFGVGSPHRNVAFTPTGFLFLDWGPGRVRNRLGLLTAGVFRNQQRVATWRAMLGEIKRDNGQCPQ
jgi:hypothetical protein